MRREYGRSGLSEAEADPDPFRQFQIWFDEVLKAELVDPHAMTLATAMPDGRPSARVVLLQSFGPSGFTFHTNYRSRKGRELEANPYAALLFFWPELERQVRVEGCVERLSAQESDAYFRTRPIGAQLSAWGSPQSEVIRNREAVEDPIAEIEQRFAGGEVPRPEFWGGYRLIAEVIEFWQGGLNRLHDRLRYRRQEEGVWVRERLAP
jgi:pyridoxamine 5'-phosphate oxidase